MPTLTQIRRAIDNTVQNRIPTVGDIPGLRGFNEVIDVVQLPAMVVMPARDTADFTGAMGRGMDTWRFDLYILVQRGESTVAQAALDQYVSGAGPRSLRQIFFEDNTLGGVVDDASCEGVREYGGKFSTARIDHVGAIVRLIVRTSGK
jgi:hypothetical protein